MLKKINFFVLIATFFIIGIGFGQVGFTESMGAVGGTTLISTHEAANGFDNDSFTMSGTGDLRNTTVSTGYVGASGAANVFLTPASPNRFFLVSGIETVSCSNLVLTFGAYKSTTASNMTELVVEFSADGVTFIPVAIPVQPTGSGTANWRLITLTLPPAANNQSNLRLRWTNTATSGPHFRIDDVSLTGSCGSISIDAISSLIYTVDCQNTDVGSVDFSTVGSFNIGNSFQVQLSDATGNFSSPLVIGTFSGVAAEGINPSGSMAFSIPAVMPAGSGYRIRLSSSNPSQISLDNGADITISLIGPCVPPHITSLIINSCNSSCSEGDNEIFFGNTGDYSMQFTDVNTNLYYGSSPFPTLNFITSTHDLPLVTHDFNTNAGCPGLFIDAFNTVVPPNSIFLLAHTDVCPLDVIDFTNLCGSGPIYVVYVNSPSWISGGNFSNSTSCSGGYRYLQSSFVTTVNTEHEIDFYYECALNSGMDGDFATWNGNGGASLFQGNDGCAFPLTVLPIELLTFHGRNENNKNYIYWATASELNNDFFNLYYSKDGFSFQLIEQIYGNGTTSVESNYSYVHRNVESGVCYYKLESVDYDGSSHNKGILAISVELNSMYFDIATQTIFFEDSSDYSVYSIEGKLVQNHSNVAEFTLMQSGLFIVRDLKKGTTYKVVVP